MGTAAVIFTTFLLSDRENHDKATQTSKWSLAYKTVAPNHPQDTISTSVWGFETAGLHKRGRFQPQSAQQKEKMRILAATAGRRG